MLHQADVEGVDRHETSLRPTDGSVCAPAHSIPRSRGEPAQALTISRSTRARREATAIGASGRVTTNRLPVPAPALCTTTQPPCAATSSLTTARPSPRPESSKPGRDQVLRERFENVRQRGRLDADAAVGHAQDDEVAVRRRQQLDRTAIRREPARVVEQIADHLRQPERIAFDLERARRDDDDQALAAPLRRRPAGLDGRADDIAKIDDRAVESELSGARSRKIEQVVDETRHVRDLTLDDRLQPGQRRGVVRTQAAEHRRRAADRRERPAQLVGRHREERSLPVLLFLGRDQQRCGLAVGLRQARVLIAEKRAALFLNGDAGE